MAKKDFKFVICHHMPERSFHFKGKQFPLCARCTGIFLGYLTIPIFHMELIKPSIILIILFSLPLIIDSFTQVMGFRESNNILRVISGFLFGAAQVALIVLIGKFITNIILNQM